MIQRYVVFLQHSVSNLHLLKSNSRTRVRGKRPNMSKYGTIRHLSNKSIINANNYRKKHANDSQKILDF